MATTVTRALPHLYETTGYSVILEVLIMDKRTKHLLIKLNLALASSFVFAFFVLPPLYDVFCDITGLNGKTAGKYTQQNNPNWQEKDSRRVQVQFIANNNESMPWVFKPKDFQVDAITGKSKTVFYFAQNPTNNDMVGQAIPSISPAEAARYFHKTECFCFNNQPLIAGESADLALQFIVDPDLPKHIHTITLSYTMFDITPEKRTQLTYNSN